MTWYIQKYILTDMKKILISVDDDIVEILEQAGNKSAYIRKAILAEQDNNLTQEVRRLAMLVDGQINDIQDIQQNIVTIKQKIDGLSSNGRTADFDSANLGSSPSEPAKIVTGNEFVPKPPDPELGYPCCQGNSPCKHWAWNDIDTVWKNTLTGKTRDA